MNAPQPDPAHDHTPHQVPPKFGLLDIVEAFTAMRHEYRNQTKETRAVAAGLGTTAAKLDEFAAQMELAIAAIPKEPSPNGPLVRQSSVDENASTAFAVRLAEIDHAVSRSIDAARRSLSSSQAANEPGAAVSATERLSSLGPVARLFCRRFAAQLDQQWQQAAAAKNDQQQTTIANVISGLAMTADHVRRQLEKQGVERIDAVGQPFNGEWMHAVEVVDSNSVPPGHVVDQLSPAYRFEDRIILYADVRIAQNERLAPSI